MSRNAEFYYKTILEQVLCKMLAAHLIGKLKYIKIKNEVWSIAVQKSQEEYL